MKIFKRVVSVILAAALTAAVLTACGGGLSADALAEQLKETYLEMMDLSAQKSGDIAPAASLERDTAMEAALQAALDHIQKDGSIPAQYRPVSDDPDHVRTGGKMRNYQATQNGGFAIEAGTADLAEMQQAVRELSEETERKFEGENWRMDGVAVATRVVNGRVYIAMGIRYVRL